MDDLISVIVSTYNRPDALDAVLRALSRQSDRHFEIVVADDGSGAATRRVVRRLARARAVPVKHVWHEDRGFRLAEIRNLGIRDERRRTTSSFSTATASRGAISSPRIAASPSPAGSSPATAS